MVKATDEPTGTHVKTLSVNEALSLARRLWLEGAAPTTKIERDELNALKADLLMAAAALRGLVAHKANEDVVYLAGC